MVALNVEPQVGEALLVVRVLRRAFRQVDQAEADAAELEAVPHLLNRDVRPCQRATVGAEHRDHGVSAPVHKGRVGRPTCGGWGGQAGGKWHRGALLRMSVDDRARLPEGRAGAGYVPLLVVVAALVTRTHLGPDLLARRADRVLLRIAAGHPHLAA